MRGARSTGGKGAHLAPIIQTILEGNGVPRPIVREMMRAASQASADNRWPFVQISPSALTRIPDLARKSPRPATTLRVWVHLLGQLRTEGAVTDATPAAINHALGIGRSHACEALRWLEDQGAIRRRHDGKIMRVFIHPNLAWRGREIDRQNALSRW